MTLQGHRMKRRSSETENQGQVRYALRSRDVYVPDHHLAKKRRVSQQQELPLRELRPPLTLKWRRGEDMPIKMGSTVQSVVIGDTVYIGGGAADRTSKRKVMKLDLKQQRWTTLPQYNAEWFTMTSLDDQLVLVGGYYPAAKKPTNQISVLQGKKWTHPHPPMNIARLCSTAVSFKNHIIVAGGNIDQGPTSSVEILDVSSRRWYIVDPMPRPQSMIKSTLVGSTLYLMGGFDHNGHTAKVVNIVDLNELIDKAKTTEQATPTLWQTIEDAPLYQSAPLSIRGSLLAVGGHSTVNYDPSSSIHLYQPGSRSWVKVGELPTARKNCTCSVLPNGEIIVAGGYARGYLSTVDFMSINS